MGKMQTKKKLGTWRNEKKKKERKRNKNLADANFQARWKEDWHQIRREDEGDGAKMIRVYEGGGGLHQGIPHILPPSLCLGPRTK